VVGCGAAGGGAGIVLAGAEFCTGAAAGWEDAGCVWLGVAAVSDVWTEAGCDVG